MLRARVLQIDRFVANACRFIRNKLQDSFVGGDFINKRVSRLQRAARTFCGVVLCDT